MAGGGLGGALAGLAGVYGGYKQGEMDEYKIDDVKRAALSKVAMGNALRLLGGGGQSNTNVMQPPGGGPGGAPGVPPGQPSQPMMPPGGSPSQPPAGPPGAPGGMPPRPMGTGAPGGLPGGMPPGPPQMPTPGAGGGQQPMGRAPMDWRQIVAAVQQANPNLPPDVLAEAVNQFLPMMNANSQQEWRMISLQLREQALQQREQQFELADATRRSEGAANRGSREKVAEENIEGRREVASARLEQQQKQFETREARLQESLKLREDSTWARLEQQKQAAQQRVEASQGRQGLAEWRAAIKAQDKHVRTKIMAASANNLMKPEEKKKLLDQADKEFSDQMEIMRNQYGGKKRGAASTTKPAETPAASQGSGADTMLQQAREAIAQGAPRDKVLERLKQAGVDASGL